MALPHAQPLEVIDIRPLGAQLSQAVSISLIKTPTLQLMRLVLRAGEDMPRHKVPGAISIQCLEGSVDVTTPTHAVLLQAGEVVVLTGGDPHALHARVDTSVLVTVLLPDS